MKTDDPKPLADDFEPRITALLLGELAPDEAAEVRRAIAENPDWTRLHDQLSGTIGRMRQAVRMEATPGGASQLSEARREALLKRFRTSAMPEITPTRRREWGWVVPLSLAAALMLLLAVGGGLPGLWRPFSQGWSNESSWGDRTSADEASSKREILDLDVIPAPMEKPSTVRRALGSFFKSVPPPTAEESRGSVRWDRNETAGSDSAGRERDFSVASAATLGRELRSESALDQKEDRFANSAPPAPSTPPPENPISARRRGISARGGDDGLASASRPAGSGGQVAEQLDALSTASNTNFEPETAGLALGGRADVSRNSPAAGSAGRKAGREEQDKTTPEAGTASPGVELFSDRDGDSMELARKPQALSEPFAFFGHAPANSLGEVAPLSGGFGGGGRGPLDERRFEKPTATELFVTQTSPGRSDWNEAPPDARQRLKQHQAVAGPAAAEQSFESNLGALRGVVDDDTSRVPAQVLRENGVAQFDAEGPVAGQRGAPTALASRIVNGAPAAEDFLAAGKPVAQLQEGFGLSKLNSVPDGYANGRDLGASVPPGAILSYRAGVVSQPLSEVTQESLPQRSNVGLGFQAKNAHGDAAVDNSAKVLELRTTLNRQPVELKLAKKVEERELSELADPKQTAQRKAGTTPAIDRLAEIEAKDSRIVSRFGHVDAPVVTNRPLPSLPSPEIVTAENAFSTFSLNVSDVSFKLAAASLEKGVLPDPSSIRSEEFINAFKYRDPEAASGVPVTFAWERAQYPFAHNRDVVRLAVRTAASGREATRPLNLVLLLDNSGSMERADRVAILREALRTLAKQLQPQDRISVVTFARTARLWVDALSGAESGNLAGRVGELNPEGGTNLEEALNLAYATASRHFAAQGINRVVLMTDGAANLGDLDPSSLKRKVESWRQRGVALDCFGIGWEGLNDDLLEELSRNGDGRYGFVNSPEEAGSNFAARLAGALRVAAADVKVQVEFNPQRVAVWRQVGYARHQLTKAQFRDNTVDAAELAAAESGNAIYIVEALPGGSGPMATVRARFREPESGRYREHAWTVPYAGQAVPLDRAAATLRLATTAAAFSEWLGRSPYAGEIQPDRLFALLQGVPATFDPDPTPRTLETMLRQAQSLSPK